MLEWYKVGEIMKIMKYGLITFFILSFILFALPFVLKGILNIGNITGMLVSFLCVLVVLNSKQLYPYLTSKITIIFVIVFLLHFVPIKFYLISIIQVIKKQQLLC